jgi:preprotein translocase subunit SecG
MISVIQTALPYVQISVAILLVTSILLQQSGAGLGEAFGGAGNVGFTTRRGFERTLFQTTIVLGILFFLSALTAVFLAV